MIQEALDAAQASPGEDLRIPGGLMAAVRRQLKDSPLSWDQALQQLVREYRRKQAV